MKKRTYTILFVVIFSLGLVLLLYPGVSNYINVKNTKEAVDAYNKKITSVTNQQKAEFFESAEKYNEMLANNIRPFSYFDVLDVTDGMMGYISIPKIGVTLPIYHGTDDKILSFAAGHIQGTSFPVGGESTHSAITGHRGLPSAKLFTDLDDMEEGDKFSIKILDEIFTYKVDKISVVKPEEVEHLKIVEGEDFITLITCTPYGINTHRLLVRGVRVGVADELAADAVSLNMRDAALMIVLPIILVAIGFAVAVVIKRRKKNEKN